MGSRRRSRELALRVLYQWDITGQKEMPNLAKAAGLFSKDIPVDEFAERLVKGVLNHHEEIDQLISQYSEHWRLDRMGVIDRNILRIATFELLYCPDTPPKVAINEAIEMGKKYGTEDSGGFINGILDRIRGEIACSPEARE